MDAFSHRPVMVAEVVEAFRVVPAGVLVDGTLGGAGHARALLEARPDCSLLGIDRDPEAVAAGRSALARYGARARVVHGGFEDLAEIAGGEVSGVLFDLGVSSHQLDRPERGFSYRVDAPLDMRMDTTRGPNAGDVVNDYEEADLASVIARFGEERFARAIARRIVARRPLRTTADLVAAVTDAIPAPARRRGPHPARRTFQAVRIEVNSELTHLEAGLDAAFGALTPGGRLAVLSYHSLEDRPVKRRMVAWSTLPPLPPGMPMAPERPDPPGRNVTRSARRPGAAEVAENRRAESARLRIVERAVERAPEPAGGGQ